MNKFLTRIGIEILNSFKRLVARDEYGYRQLWLGCTVGVGFDDDKYDVFRPELWTPRVTRFMKERLSAANFFLDYSAEGQNADTIHIPHISDVFSATAIPVTSGTVTAIAIDETKSDLVIDRWYGTAYYITKFEQREIMKRPNIIAEYQMAMGYRLARELERDLLASTSILNSVPARAGLTTTDLVATNIEYALSIHASNSTPKNECRFFISPKTYWNDIMAIQKYYDASQYGRASLPQGAHDILYGMPVTITPNVPKETGDLGVCNSIVHPSFLAHARTGVDFVALPSESLRKKINSDLIWGKKILHSNRCVRVLATSN